MCIHTIHFSLSLYIYIYIHAYTYTYIYIYIHIHTYIPVCSTLDSDAGELLPDKGEVRESLDL